MYSLEILPIAKKDIDSIIYYITNILKNKTAAKKLARKFISSANSILIFPYGTSVYQPINKLKYEYRSVKIENFLMFYIINEEEKIITIVRVLYKKMDFANILK